MSEAIKHKCCKLIWASGSYYGYPCGKGAAFEHEGKWYCKTHHPPTVKAKNEAYSAKLDSEFAAKRAQEKAAIDAAAEQKRKADAYDQLAERNAELVEALQDFVERFGPVRDEFIFSKRMAIDKARAALAKCQPKPQEATP